MDVDCPMKSSPFSSSSSGDDESHLDMMSMMMQIGKLPDFFDPSFPPPNPPLFPAGIQIPSSSIHSSAVQFLPPPPQNPSSFLFSMEKKNSTAAIREMIFRIAAMQRVHIDPESIKPPKRRNVRISKDPQSVAARQRRERISERIRILQRLVPGGTKMDTASMLDEAVHYVKFLKKQVQTLEQAGANRTVLPGFVFNGLTMGNNNNNNNVNISSNNNLGFSNSLLKNCQQGNSSFLGSTQMLR